MAWTRCSSSSAGPMGDHRSTVDQVAERASPPEAQGLFQQVHRSRRLHTRRTAGPVEEQGELLGVERITIQGELIVPAVRNQPVAEHPAQIRDVGPHDVRCRRRRCIAPDLLDDAVDAE